MVRAFILVECQPGQIAAATRELKELEGVEQVDSILGPYDVVLCTKKDDLDTLGNFVTEQVQRVPGVKGTTTCLSIQP